MLSSAPRGPGRPPRPSPPRPASGTRLHDAVGFTLQS
jgi:hypothetical protein